MLYVRWLPAINSKKRHFPIFIFSINFFHWYVKAHIEFILPYPTWLDGYWFNKERGTNNFWLSLGEKPLILLIFPDLLDLLIICHCPASSDPSVWGLEIQCWGDLKNHGILFYNWCLISQLIDFILKLDILLIWVSFNCLYISKNFSIFPKLVQFINT